LLDRAVAAGEIRPDISPEDVLRILAGMSYMYDQPGWHESVLRLVDVFVDGLRVQTGPTTLVSRRDEAKRGVKRGPRQNGPRKSRK
jgi:hypothetical protein